MTYTTTTAYRILVARAIMGDAVTLLPATIKIGTGYYNAGTGVLTPPMPSATDLMTPVITGIVAVVTRSAQVVRITAADITSGTPVNISEVGVFLADGTMVLIDVFRPRTLQPGVPLSVAYSLLPEVN